MLALFALGITPKIAVHALVAHHTDRHLSVWQATKDQLNKDGFHCRVDNLVVELPYIHCPLSLQWVVPAAFGICQMRVENQYHSFSDIIFGLRGPPDAV